LAGQCLAQQKGLALFYVFKTHLIFPGICGLRRVTARMTRWVQTQIGTDLSYHIRMHDPLKHHRKKLNHDEDTSIEVFYEGKGQYAEDGATLSNISAPRPEERRVPTHGC